MRLEEIQNTLKAFMVTVRLPKERRSAKTLIHAETSSAAQAMAAELFGRNNVSGVTQVTAEAAQPSPEQARIKSLNDQAKRIKQQAKTEKLRLNVKQAQQKLSALKPTTAIAPR